MNRRPLIAGNWKMYKTADQAADMVRKLKESVADARDVDILIAPPFTALVPVAAQIRGSNIELGAQNMHWETEGAFTGEISAPMLLQAGCSYVIIGHSERRLYFGETDETVNRKLGAAIRAGLKAILCVGETESQRDAGEAFSVLDKQVQNGLRGFVLDQMQNLIIAYEPVWAIGTGKTATTEQAQEVHAYLRKRFGEQFGSDFAGSLRLLYGGSVKPSNIKGLMAMADVDGALVGGASLDPQSFSQLVHYNRN